MEIEATQEQGFLLQSSKSLFIKSKTLINYKQLNPKPEALLDYK